MLSNPRLVLCLLLVAALGPSAGRAQERPAATGALYLDVRDAPLAEALAALRAQSGVDLVFAEALVEGRRASCRHTGEDVRRALACVLSGTGLHAERVRRRQYVIVGAGRAEEPLGTAGEGRRRATLAGFVTDAETGERLPGAHVALPALRLGTATNEAGFFSVARLPRRRYRVRASYVGYRALDTTVAARSLRSSREEELLTLRLQPQALQAREVVVRPEEARAAAAAVPRASETGSGHVLSAQALRGLPSFMGEGDLIQGLETLPGVQKSGAIGGGMSVRGGQTDQNKYLLDGAPVYHPWHAFNLLSTFQTGTLQSVRLHKGAFPAQHGGRLASVLDAQMKDGRHAGGDAPRTTVGLSPLSGRLLVEAPLSERLSLMVSGRRSYLDLLVGKRHPVEERGRRDTLRTGYFFYDTSAKLSARLSERHRFSVSYYHGRDNLDLRLPFDLSLDFSSWLRPADFFFEIGQNWENQLVSARHRWLASERLFVTTTAYRSEYSAREAAFVRPSADASVASDYRVRLRDHGLKLDADYALAPAHRVSAGLQVTHRRFSSRLATDLRRASDTGPGTEAEQSRQRAVQAAAYVQDTWRPVPRLEVRPGVRASAFSSGGHVRLSPRLAATYRAHPRWLTVRAGAGLYAQYLHRLRDRYSLVYDLVSSRWVPVSARVEPGRAAGVSLGAESRPWPFLTLRAAAYLRRAGRVLVPADPQQRKDQLQSVGIEAGALLGQYDAAATRARGVEVEARFDPAGPWRARLGYTAARSMVRPTGPSDGPSRPESANLADPSRAEAYPDRYDVPHAVRAGVRYTGALWTAGLTTEARSGYPTTVPVARYQLADPLAAGEPTTYLHRPHLGNGRLSPHLRVDASLGRRFAWLGARWHTQLHLYNATGRRNVIGRRYELDEASRRVHTRSQRGLPILPLFEVEVEL